MPLQHQGTVWCYLHQLLLFLRSLPDEAGGVGCGSGGGAQSVELINCNSALTHTATEPGREREGGNGAGVNDAVVAVATTADDAPPPKM